MLRDAVTANQSNDKITDLLCNLYRYMNENQWMGACHATCAVLYVALKELGENVELCIGEGSHYTSIKFIQLVKDANLRQSMSRRANCWDNAPQESFFGHMKDELNLSNCDTFDDIEKAVTDWTEYYNTERYQWDLAKLAPVEYYKYLTTGVYPLITPKPKGYKKQSEALK